MAGDGGATAAALLIAASRSLARACDKIDFSDFATHTYNPLVYARAAHENYLRRADSFAAAPRALFLGMNPGPWGMAQTGVPFGEIGAARDWLRIEGEIGKPKNESARRRIDGWRCARAEVSGRRLWGLFRARSESARDFLRGHFVLNYCPLLFLRDDGKTCRNLTPDKLPRRLSEPLFAACDAHLRAVIAALAPRFLIGVGAFAESRLAAAQNPDSKNAVVVGRILHPSPANPAANKNFEETATRQLRALGAWR